MKITLFEHQNFENLGSIEIDSFPKKGDSVVFGDNLYVVVRRIYSENGNGLIINEQNPLENNLTF
ncbi:hypothetical protein D2V93_15915 [Flagellimonas taeanensis]|uniref:hypothetical protein n=1 Tax=Flavobacteriaceae TaxID=49546 RepID=UPI000E67BD64|nr:MULTISPECIES: hypothetical protein [Allomuricauda]MDC6383878.1 hypothetical protein [Muricauda sp. SK9]RIV48496.1 hypothetical protein D2V93_15915 [Allomuricauda taeanensis]